MLKKQARTLADLHKSIGPEGLNSKNDQETCMVEIEQTTEMLEEATKEHNKAMAKTYELLKNLLSCDPETQWDWICLEMH
jgi:hypothetical protein